MARQPEVNDLMAELSELKRRVKDLETAPSLQSSSIGAGGLRSGNYVPGVSGYMLQADKLEVGDILLRGGIIGNDALSNPIVPDVINAAAGVTFTTAAYYDGTSVNLVVPEGFSRLSLSLHSGIFCFGNSNSTGGSNGVGGDAINCRTYAGGLVGEGFLDGVPGGGGFASVFSSLGCLFTGLTAGDVIHVATQTRSNYQNIPANAGNKATLSGTALWLR